MDLSDGLPRLRNDRNRDGRVCVVPDDHEYSWRGGRLLPGMSVEIVDDFGNVLPGIQGTVRIRGPSDVSGYIGDPEQSRAAFRDGWFYPGDVGSLSSDKLLRISGRVKPVINLGGEKVKPEAIEEVVLSFEGIGQAAAFGTTDAMGIEELRRRRPHGLERGRRARALRSQAAARADPTRFVVVKELPLNAIGKVDRRRLAEIAKAKAS